MPLKVPLNAHVRRGLLDAYFFFSRIFFDPIAAGNRAAGTIRALPIYGANLARYARGNRRRSLRFSIRNAWFRTYDRFSAAGSLTSHYFWQDLWAATNLFESGVHHHVDVGSRIDGFIAHILPFCEVTYVDIRPLEVAWPKFHFLQGAVVTMPFDDGEVQSLSSLHVIEHIGLGRYGDPVDAEGPWKAARELTRVLAPGGKLLVGVPTGLERVCFDAHRIFAPETVRSMFEDLELVEFSFINDRNRLIRNAGFDDARDAYYGCGLFEFRKPFATTMESH
jgi:SAM-dependent methyltransferase